MDTKNLAIICGIIIICVLVGAVAIASNHPKETQITVLSNSSLYDYENVTVQLTAENGTALANQSVNVTIVDANGSRNIQNFITDGEGKASFALKDLPAGNYTLECSFGGNSRYRQSDCTSDLEIFETPAVESSTSQYSSLESQGYHWSAQTGEYTKLLPISSEQFYKDHGYYGGYAITPDGRIIEIG